MTATGRVESVPVEPIVLRVGDQMPAYTLGPLTRTDFVRYAGAGGDFNPIHHDEPLAQRAGLPSVFGMGMLHAGVLGLRLARWVGPLNIRSFSARFTGQVWPGDTLTLTGTVTSVSEVDGELCAELQLTVARDDDEVVLRAAAIAQVRGVAR